MALRVALVHDWLTGMRGGEYVLDAIAEIFPKAELFTLLYIPGRYTPSIVSLKRHTSFLQRIPGIEHRYRYFLPLMPRAIERIDLTGFDLVISSSHCVAKGIKKPSGAVHVSYIHAPVRYFWDRFEDYFGPGRASFPVRFAAKWLRPSFQQWDRESSSESRIDALVANSSFIAKQIERTCGRKASVIHPFADLSRFNLTRKRGRNYLMVGAFAPNKRVDLAIEAFNRLKLPLLIIGSGQDEARLKKIAGPTIEFLGAQSNQVINDFYAKCRAFVFPGLEDFGITPVEAMAAGAPVIAYGAGGALETVTSKTGIFFTPQTVEALMDAVLKVEREEVQFQEEDCRARAKEFTRDRFQVELAQTVFNTWLKAGKDPAPLREVLAQSYSEIVKSTNFCE